MSRLGAISSSFLFRPEGGVPVTPTVQASALDVDERTTSQILSWVRGNGGKVLLIGKQDLPVDPGLLVDGTEYSHNTIFSAGQELGTGNYVCYIGTDSSIEITNLNIDSHYFWDIYEFNDDGFRYLQTIDTNTLETRTAFIYDETFLHDSGSGDPAGLVYLEASADVFYDFSLLTFADEVNVSNGDAGLVDYGPGTNTGTIVGTPVTNEITINGSPRKAVRTTGGSAINTNATFTSAFSDPDGFEIHAIFELLDGIVGAGNPTYICGVTSGTSAFSLRVTNDGRIQILYNTPGGNTSWVSSAAVFANGVNSEQDIKCKLDFNLNAFTIVLNGTNVTGSASGFAIASQDPTTWTSSHNLYVGNRNSNGTVEGSQATSISICRFAVTPITSVQESADILAYFDFTATGSSFSLNDYTIYEDTGFDIDVVSNELIIGGEPLGWEDKVVHNTVIGANLEEFDVEAKIRLLASPTIDTPGIGIGVINDVATEANRAAVSEFHTDSDSAYFGRALLYAGDGTVSSPASIPFRTQSGTAFVPANGESYIIRLSRNLQSNDVEYVARVIDTITGEDIITTSWIEIGRPSSAFFGTTMRPFIHVNGGDFAVEYFRVLRTGDDVSPPPAETFDVYVSPTGNDISNDGLSATTPKATWAAGLTILNAMVGNKKMSVTTGNFTTDTFLTLGLDKEIHGAGIDNTILTGASNLFQNFGQSEASALIRLSTGSNTVESHVAGNNILKDFTLSGNNRQMRFGLFIQNRDNVETISVGIKNFNWAGAWLRWVDDSAFDLTIENSGGDNAFSQGGPPCNNMNPQIPSPVSVGGTFGTGAILGWDLEDVTFTGDINNTMYRSGFAFKVYGKPTGAYIGRFTNVTFHDQAITMNNNTGVRDNSGNNFLVNINHEFSVGSSDDLRYDNLRFENIDFTGGFLSFGQRTSGTPNNASLNGDTVIDGCTFIPGTSFTGPTPSIESHVHKLKIRNCYFIGPTIAYTTNNTTSYPHTYVDWVFENNVIETVQTSASTQAVFCRLNHQPLSNAIFRRNTIVYTTASGSQQPLVRLAATSGQSSLLIENNAVYGQPPATTNIWDISGSGLTATTVRNNKATHSNVLQTVTGVTGGAGQNNTTGLAAANFFLATGVKPDPYYRPKTAANGGVLDGTGFGGVDVGAYDTL